MSPFPPLPYWEATTFVIVLSPARYSTGFPYHRDELGTYVDGLRHYVSSVRPNSNRPKNWRWFHRYRGAAAVVRFFRTPESIAAAFKRVRPESLDAKRNKRKAFLATLYQWSSR